MKTIRVKVGTLRQMIKEDFKKIKLIKESGGRAVSILDKKLPKKFKDMDYMEFFEEIEDMLSNPDKYKIKERSDLYTSLEWAFDNQEQSFAMYHDM